MMLKLLTFSLFLENLYVYNGNVFVNMKVTELNLETGMNGTRKILLTFF